MGPHGGEIGHPACAHGDHLVVNGRRDAVGRCEGRKLDDQSFLQRIFDVRRREIQHIRRQWSVWRLSGGIVRCAIFLKSHTRVVVIGNHFQPGVADLVGVVIQTHGSAGQIVEQRLQGLVKQRQPVLHPDLAAAFGDGGIQGIVRDRPERFAIAGTEARNGIIVEKNFIGRLQNQRVDTFQTFLGHRVERPQRLDFVTEQIDAQRQGLSRRENIDDAAADGVFAGLPHGTGPVKAVAGEEIAEIVQVDMRSDRKCPARITDDVARRYPLNDRVHSGQHHHRHTCRRIQRRHPGQGIDPGCHVFAVRRHPVVGKTIPGRKTDDVERRSKKAESVLDSRQTRRIPGDMNVNRSGLRAVQRVSQHLRVISFGYARQQIPACRRERFFQ